MTCHSEDNIGFMKYQIKSNQTNYIIVRSKVDQRADQLCLPHVGKLQQKKN